MRGEQGVQDRGQAGMAAPADPQPAFRRRQRGIGGGDDALLDLGDDVVRLPDPPVDHQPARAFRHETPQEEDEESEHGAGPEGDAPSPIRRQQRRVEQDQRAERAERRADPEAAVDDNVGPPAIARRDELLDRRVDRRALAADAGAGQEAEQREAPEAPRQGGRRCRQEIEAERNGEEPLAAPTVGQPAEEDGAGDGAQQVGAGGSADLGRAEAQGRALLQRRRDRAGQRHLEPIENPGDAEGDDDKPVEPAPRQAIEPRRDIRLDERACLPDDLITAHPSPLRCRRRVNAPRGLFHRPTARPQSRTTRCSSRDSGRRFRWSKGSNTFGLNSRATLLSSY